MLQGMSDTGKPPLLNVTVNTSYEVCLCNRHTLPK